MPENEMTGNLFLFARSEPNRSAMTPTPAETIKPEARLVERIAAGDEDAFGELYRMFAPLVHGITLARVPRDEVDDIVQEVFISAYKNIDTLRDKNAVGGWLAMIARNRAVEFYRRAKPTEELSEEISSGKSQRTEANEVLATIRTLPETYKETLVLRLVEGMSGQEIAERTGMTSESVRVNLHRGMKLLREKLGIEVKR
jgi:RNA polymerase sigma-70 factor (ECF subfamily)